MNTLFLLVLVAGVVQCVPVERSFSIPGRSEVRDDNGQFAFRYESPEGTVVQEQGSLKRNLEDTGNVLVKKGTVKYVSPEGLPIELTYTADENGFQAFGRHLPVAPVSHPKPCFTS